MSSGTEVFERKSLCFVNRDKQGRLWLYRMADVVDGEVVPFACDDDKPRYYENRTRLYSKDAPSYEGKMGVWTWSATPNMTDPEKDYVESYYNTSLDPIELIVLEGSWNATKLGEALRDGLLEQVPSVKKALYCYRLQQGDYLAGVLCEEKDYEVKDGHLFLKDEVIYLDYYTIHSRNRVTVSSPDLLMFKDFYRLLNLGKPTKKVWVRSPGEIVKNVLLRAMPWSAAKNYTTKQKWKEMRALIEEVTDFSLYKEVAKEAECTAEEAKGFVEDFLAHAEDFVSVKDISEEALKAALERNPEIRERIQDGMMEEWEKKNRFAIRSGEEELSALRVNLEKARKEEGQAAADLEKKKQQLASLTKQVEEKGRQKEDVEREIQEEREKIQEERAALEAAARAQEKAPAENISASLLESVAGRLSQMGGGSAPVYLPGALLPEEDSISYGHWEQMMGHLEKMLYDAGVAKSFTGSLAGFLYAAYLNGAPVLLAGPNGRAIAQALSAALFGKLCGELDLGQPYNPEGLGQMLDGPEEMLLVSSPFAPAWSDALPSLLLPPRRFCVLVTPFGEDLLLQPRSWQNYALPVFTELLVDGPPMEYYTAGRRLPTFVDFAPEQGYRQNPLYKEFKLMPFARQRMGAVLSAASILSREEGDAGVFLYGLLPHAFMEGRKEKLAQLLEEDMNIDTMRRDLMLDFLEARG